MMFIDCIEDPMSLFDNSFKSDKLKEFSNLKGSFVTLASSLRSKLYAFKVEEKFYVNLIEDIDDNLVRIQVYEAENFGDLINKADSLLKWDKKIINEETLSLLGVSQ